ncbi:cytochrome P450 CYP94D108-like [Typha angustifolia]|uniref:cytochrome P450 CYP94D108-like n=1 Tax=Typha angustifolia TaxID=59011 RepID=UPI003C2DD3AF
MATEDLPISSYSALLLFLLSSLYLLSKCWKNNFSSPRPYPLLGHLPQFLANRRRLADWIASCLAASPNNTFFLYRPGGVRGVITANPANVEHVLRVRFDNYPKGARFISNLHDFLGRGIFNSDGNTWRLQRKTASFEFNTRSLRSFVVRCVQHETRCRLLPLLQTACTKSQLLDLQDVLERFAFDNVCKVAFDLDPACLGQEDEDSDVDFSSGFAEAFKDAANLSAGRFRYAIPNLWRLKKLLGVGSERRLRESISTVHDFSLRIIRSRKKEVRKVAEKDDLLSRFIADEREHYSEEFLRDIVISFLLAGRETTSSALTWFFWILASRPDVEERILEEIRLMRTRKRSSDKDEPSFDFEELKEMQYLHAAISESMRLYPPVPVNSTEAKEDDVLPDGTAVKKGWFVSYNSYGMGRMKAIWGEDCEEYKPERWLTEDGHFRPESPFRFPAFHAGPRMCLGKEMAYIQMKSIVASLLERFVIEVQDMDTSPEKVMSLTLRMKGGLPVSVKDRCMDKI